MIQENAFATYTSLCHQVLLARKQWVISAWLTL